MNILLSIAAAASVLAPPVLRDGAVVTIDDYPENALRQGEEGAVIFSVFVDPKGKALSCLAERIVEKDFTTTVCGKVRRGGFVPAKDREGRPVHGFYRSVSSFWLPEPGKQSTYPLTLVPEYSFSVKPVPGLLTEPRDVPIAVYVNEAGHVADCSSRDNLGDERLVAAACAQVTAQWTITPFSDKEGMHRPYIRAVSVKFLPETAKP